MEDVEVVVVVVAVVVAVAVVQEVVRKVLGEDAEANAEAEANAVLVELDVAEAEEAVEAVVEMMTKRLIPSMLELEDADEAAVKEAAVKEAISVHKRYVNISILIIN